MLCTYCYTAGAVTNSGAVRGSPGPYGKTQVDSVGPQHNKHREHFGLCLMQM